GDVFGEGLAVDQQRRHLAVGAHLQVFRRLVLALGQGNGFALEFRAGFLERDVGRHGAGAGGEIIGEHGWLRSVGDGWAGLSTGPRMTATAQDCNSAMPARAGDRDQSGANTSSGSATPRRLWDPSGRRRRPLAAVKAAEASTGSPSALLRPWRRLAWLTAGPITVKSRRRLVPILPKATSPRCSARPQAMGARPAVAR